jgi:hypothetical protein
VRIPGASGFQVRVLGGSPLFSSCALFSID